MCAILQRTQCEMFANRKKKEYVTRIISGWKMLAEIVEKSTWPSFPYLALTLAQNILKQIVRELVRLRSIENHESFTHAKDDLGS